MPGSRLPDGSHVRIEKSDLQHVIQQLLELKYRVVGPRVVDGAVVYSELDCVDKLPLGWIDEQDGGHYRLHLSAEAGYFDHVVGPHSLKNLIFPPRETLLHASKDQDGHWQMAVPEAPSQPLAVIGVRGCDLQALRVLDRVLLEGPYVDTAYQARRESLFVIAVNCRRAATTCFCHSMGTGPAARQSFDLALTEMNEHFVVEIGTPRGGEVITAAPWQPCPVDEIEAARRQPAQLKKEMEGRSASGQGRALDTSDIQELLMGNLDHSRWDEVAERCLACANCTMVCPTCFCVSVEEVSDLTGDEVRRERTWDSCFTAEHSYMSHGSVRKSTRSRYRQWLTHKLATWQDQFDTSGCVGCGRCITWCPVGIDLTEEVAAIRGEEP